MTWTDCSKRMPPEGTPCIVQLANHDIVVAFRCASWETGFFTSSALQPRRGVPRRELSRLVSPPARWRKLGALPEAVRPIELRILLEHASQVEARKIGTLLGVWALKEKFPARSDRAVREKLSKAREAGKLGRKS